MSTHLQQPIQEVVAASILGSVDVPESVHINISVTDADSVRELIIRKSGRDRDEYSLCALRIGLLSLKHARGQVDAEAVKREGDKLLQDTGYAPMHSLDAGIGVYADWMRANPNAWRAPSVIPA